MRAVRHMGFLAVVAAAACLLLACSALPALALAAVPPSAERSVEGLTDEQVASLDECIVAALTSQEFDDACAAQPAVREYSVDVYSADIAYQTLTSALAAYADSFACAYPDLFYAMGQELPAVTNYAGKAKLLKLALPFALGDIPDMRARYEQALANALAWAPASMDDAQKVKAVHDYLVRTCAYNAQADAGASIAPWTAYGALVEGRPVCQGYSLAFIAVMNRLGIAARYVMQEANGALHGWNRVRVDGSWYNLDITHDDPLPDAGASSACAASYFMKSDAWFKAHPSDGYHTLWSPAPAEEAAVDTTYDEGFEWPVYVGAGGQTASATSDDERKEDEGPGASGDSDSTGGDVRQSGQHTQQSAARTPNTLKVRALGIKAKASKLKKKQLKIKTAKAFKVTGAKGALSFKRGTITCKKKLAKQAKKKIKVSSAGVVTLKKGLKKGTYKIKVTAHASGTTDYLPLDKTVTLKVTVK